MSNYHFKPSNSLSLYVHEKKEKRRKVLEAVRERRKEMYKSFLKKTRLQADSEMV